MIRTACRAAFVVVTACALVAPAASASPRGDDAPGDDDPVSGDAAFSVAPGGASGQTGRATFTFDVFPDQVLQDTVSVFNFTDDEMTFRLYTNDAYNTDDGAFAVWGPDRDPEEVGVWVELPVDEVTVNPKSRIDVPFLIRIPRTATPGDHAGGIVALSTTATGQVTEGDTDVDIFRSVGARIYLRVAGDIAPHLDIDQISVTTAQPVLPWITGDGKAVIEYTVTNTGNLRLAPTTEASLDGPFGIGGSSSTPVELRELLPGSSITVRQTIDAVPSLGRMTAHISATAGDLEVNRSQVVWAVPWVPLLLLALAILLLRWARRRSREAPASGEPPPEPQPVRELVSR